MMGRDKISLLFEALAVALEAAIGELQASRVTRLCARLQAAGDDFARVLHWARQIEAHAQNRSCNSLDRSVAVDGMRRVIDSMLVPVPSGLDRVDIHG